jgi:hypothetical protein
LDPGAALELADDPVKLADLFSQLEALESKSCLPSPRSASIAATYSCIPAREAPWLSGSNYSCGPVKHGCGVMPLCTAEAPDSQLGAAMLAIAGLAVNPRSPSALAATAASILTLVRTSFLRELPAVSRIRHIVTALQMAVNGVRSVHPLPARSAASTAAQPRPDTRCGTRRVCQDEPHASRSREFCSARGSGRGQRL